MTLNNPTADYVEKVVSIAAAPEVIYQYFTDPAKMVLWKGTQAWLSPEVGGLYRVNVTGRETASGEYLELTPFSRIVFTWGWDDGPVPPGSTTVEVDLIPQGEVTLVRLRHSGLSGEAAIGHSEGWDHYLERLARAAEGQTLEIDPWVVQAT